MPVSVFDLFKVGVGPSSSHTVGPMLAAHRFATELDHNGLLARTTRVQIHLFGSLSATGVGHATDRACLMGLLGELPDQIDPDRIEPWFHQIVSEQRLRLLQRHPIDFSYDDDLEFDSVPLPEHPNALRLTAFNDAGDKLLSQTYFSIGGGFVHQQGQEETVEQAPLDLPYPFRSAAELLALCQQHKISISELVLRNEASLIPRPQVIERLVAIWKVMDAVIDRGLHSRGILPGGLAVKRRAPELYQALRLKQPANLIAASLEGMDWVNLYALATNEENAAGGRIVTAPTNGAAGVMPAVLKYLIRYNQGLDDEQIARFFLGAAAVGALCKTNASISGADVGCQGEVGSACAMAAAGLTEVLGGSPLQVENAAEIGLEHNLGLTCDPVGGLVQVPCIERNAIAAMKAINAAQIALRGDGDHFVSLDKVIKTMKDTGHDMQAKYKETSEGGLAVNVIDC
ncbi:L-serine ammonia-lyase [Motiliproteus sp.]|uniref:L-serine ammonia-lyase n=1 Tax=Motiliproteus sp. TaxID=1898955 RepID=UPI003BA85FB0